ncbi:hypothetical protein [Parabacteroides sp. FAFU027]|uniref:hypothetical protein n=1 Tax=Parabacteroides sp. FAFU027 TaxID=2922715 RepID=UPI001FAEA70A|nr:hypothetical protein [Parabacteroides sp. FAFU027]
MKQLKRQCISTVILLSVITALWASDTNNCRIVFYRNDNLENQHPAYKVYMADSIITKLKNKTYYSFYVKPGCLYFKNYNPNLSEIHLKTQKDKTYFIKLGPNPVSPDSSLVFTLMDSAMARKELIRNQLTNKAPTKKDVFIPQNSIGFNIGGGFGLDKASAVNTTTAEDAYISFGGGLDLGLNYTLEFIKNFGLALDFGYKRSFLHPSISNGSIHFERKNISITPLYMIPLNKKESSRLKIGIGGDLYLNPEMTFELSKIKDGFDDTWKYKDQQGFHISAFYETIMPSDWSFQIGITYYNVNYNFKSGEKYYPTSDFLINGQGGGINITGGLGYHF